jgi:hypothetical protein
MLILGVSVDVATLSDASAHIGAPNPPAQILILIFIYGNM